MYDALQTFDALLFVGVVSKVKIFVFAYPPPTPKGEYILKKFEYSVINFSIYEFNEMYSPLGVGGG